MWNKGTSDVCIFSQLVNTHNHLRYVKDGLGNSRAMLTLSGSRRIHVGTPAKRPPSTESASPSRPNWAQSSFDNSTLNAILKASPRKGKRDDTTPPKPISHLFKPSAEEMGKWAKSSELFHPSVNRQTS